MIVIALTICLKADPDICRRREIRTDASNLMTCIIGAATVVPSYVPDDWEVQEFTCKEGQEA